MDWKKDKTYEELYGERKAKELKINLSEKMKEKHKKNRSKVYDKISKSLKGKTFSEEHKKKLSEWQKGRKLSRETKQKQSKSRNLRKKRLEY